VPRLRAIGGHEQRQTTGIREGEALVCRPAWPVEQRYLSGVLVHHQVSRTEEVLNNVLKMCDRWWKSAKLGAIKKPLKAAIYQGFVKLDETLWNWRWCRSRGRTYRLQAAILLDLSIINLSMYT